MESARPSTMEQLEFWVTDVWNGGEEEIFRPLGVIRQSGSPAHEAPSTAKTPTARGHVKHNAVSVPANAIIIRTVQGRPRRFRPLIKGFDRMLDPLAICPRMGVTNRIIRRSPSEAMAADWALVWLDLARAFERLAPTMVHKRNESPVRHPLSVA